METSIKMYDKNKHSKYGTTYSKKVHQKTILCDILVRNSKIGNTTSCYKEFLDRTEYWDWIAYHITRGTGHTKHCIYKPRTVSPTKPQVVNTTYETMKISWLLFENQQHWNRAEDAKRATEKYSSILEEYGVSSIVYHLVISQGRICR